MKTAMTLLLAARILVTFGTGTAMERHEVPSAADFSRQYLVAPRTIDGGAGSFDVNAPRGDAPFDFIALANPG
jgi:hypothetical protein